MFYNLNFIQMIKKKPEEKYPIHSFTVIINYFINPFVNNNKNNYPLTVLLRSRINTLKFQDYSCRFFDLLLLPRL